MSSHFSLARWGALERRKSRSSRNARTPRRNLPASSSPCVNHPSTHRRRSVCSLSTLDIFASDVAWSWVKDKASFVFPPAPCCVCVPKDCVVLSAAMTSTPRSALRSSRKISSSTTRNSAICSGERRVASFAVSPPCLFTTPRYSLSSSGHFTRRMSRSRNRSARAMSDQKRSNGAGSSPRRNACDAETDFRSAPDSLALVMISWCMRLALSYNITRLAIIACRKIWCSCVRGAAIAGAGARRAPSGRARAEIQSARSWAPRATDLRAA
mmetsp:Transcript_12792/g.54724  ORF Transcript_12792/g.54724 Transcript_12792/m.54724 type:complete len:269 (-) Transcript_12792:142-948(-)